MRAFQAWAKLLALWFFLAVCGSAGAALTPEEATKVGGDLNLVGGGLSHLNQELAGV